MRVARRISTQRVITGQEPINGKLSAEELDAVIMKNIASTPIPLDDVELVDMTKTAFNSAMNAQAKADADATVAAEEQAAQTIEARVKALEEAHGIEYDDGYKGSIEDRLAALEEATK